MKLFDKLTGILYPPKCVLCRRVLPDNVSDLCHDCRKNVPEYPKAKFKLSFVAGWTALWYYKDTVRYSILRYKFYGAKSYGAVYGRLLAMKLASLPDCQWDVLAYVPVGKLRLYRRGYDQVALIAQSFGAESGMDTTPILKKIRNTPPQSRIPDAAHRRANVLGAYQVIDPEAVAGKRILLLDDIITTGATVSECARVLLTAGAKEVYCAAIAAAVQDKKDKKL